MKTAYLRESKELRYFHPTEKVWYVIQPSVFAKTSYMITRLGNGYSDSDYSQIVMIGSMNHCLAKIQALKNQVAVNSLEGILK